MKALKDLNFPFIGWRGVFIILAVLAVVLLVGIPKSHHDAAAEEQSTVRKPSGTEDPMVELRRLLDEGKAKPAWKYYLETYWPFGAGVAVFLGLVVIITMLVHRGKPSDEEGILTLQDTEESTMANVDLSAVLQMDHQALEHLNQREGLGLKPEQYEGDDERFRRNILANLAHKFQNERNDAQGAMSGYEQEAESKVKKVKTWAWVLGAVAGLAVILFIGFWQIYPHPQTVAERDEAKAKVKELNTAIDGEGGYKAQIESLNTAINGTGGYKSQITTLNTAIDGENGYKAQVAAKDKQIGDLTSQLTQAQQQLAARGRGGRRGAAAPAPARTPGRRPNPWD